jgi:hypothetical protein
MRDDDIFNLSNLSDIPDSIKGELKILSRDGFEMKIIELFKKAGRELNIDEVTVAYYRFFKEEKNRSQIMTKLYNMSRSEHSAIKSIEGRKGVYKLNLEDSE